MKRFFKNIQDHPKITLLLLVLLSAACIPAILRLKVRSEISQLLPASLPAAQAYRTQMDHYARGQDGYIVYVRSSGRDAVMAAAEEFAVAVKKDIPYSVAVFGMDTTFVNRYALWLTDPWLLQLCADNVSGTSPSEMLAMMNTVMETVEPSHFDGSGGGSPASWIRNLIDALMVLEEKPDRIREALPGKLRMVLAGPPMRLAPDGKSGFFFVLMDGKKAGAPESFAFAEQLKKAAARFSDESRTVTVTGNMMLLYEESAFLMDRLKVSILGTAVMMFIFLLLVYRNAKALATLFISLGFSLILSIGLVSLITGGEIHIVTAAFVLLILGLGIDFAIHLHARLKGTGDVPGTAAATLKSLVIAAGSTVIIFLCLNITGLPSLTQLGWVVAVGICLSLAVSSVTVPAMISLGKKEGADSVPEPAEKEHSGKLLPVFFILVVISAGIGGWLFSRSTMERDLRTLRPAGIPADAALDTVIRTFGFYPDELSMEVTDPGSLDAVIAKLRSDPLVKSVSSPRELLLSPAREARTRKALGTLLRNSIQTDPDGGRLRKEVHRFRLNLTDLAQMAFATGNFTFRDYLNTEVQPGGRLFRLDSLLSLEGMKRNCRIYESTGNPVLTEMTRRLAGSPPYTLQDLPMVMRDRFFPVTGDREGCLVLVRLRRDIWNPEVYTRVNDYLLPKFPGLTGAALLSHKIVDLVIVRGAWGLALGAAVCLLLMFFFLKSVKRSLLGFVPIVVAFFHTGYVFWLGKVIDKPLLNYISITSLILVAGIGLDYSIHAQTASAASRGKVLRSVLVSGITSLIGFGGLWFCGHAGLQGLGLALVAGLSVCVAWSVLVLYGRKENDGAVTENTASEKE